MSELQTKTAADSPDFYRAILDALPGPLCVVDNRGDISYRNVSFDVHVAPDRPRNLVELLVHPVEGSSILDKLRGPDRVQTHDNGTVRAISRYYLVTHRLVLPDRPDDRFLVILQNRAAANIPPSHVQEMMHNRNDERYGRSAIDSTLDVTVDAEVDDVTGLPNGRALEQQLSHQWQRAHTFGIEISLLMFDFTEPGATDDQTAELARIVGQSRLRPTDLLARVDDGTFALLLPDTPEAGALIVQYRLGEFLQRLAPAPVSIGVASATPRAPDGWETLTNAARADLGDDRSRPTGEPSAA